MYGHDAATTHNRGISVILHHRRNAEALMKTGNTYRRYKKPGPGIAPSWVAKAYGLKSLQQMAELTGKSATWLKKTYNEQPKLFMSYVNRACVEKASC